MCRLVEEVGVAGIVSGGEMIMNMLMINLTVIAVGKHLQVTVSVKLYEKWRVKLSRDE